MVSAVEAKNAVVVLVEDAGEFAAGLSAAGDAEDAVLVVGDMTCGAVSSMQRGSMSQPSRHC